VFPARGLYRVTGVFEARSGDTLMLVRHDVVPGFMDEMQSMAIFADSPERLAAAGLARGDRVRLTVRQEKDRLVAIEILPFEATANFGVVRLRLDARETPAAIIDDLKSLIGEFPGDAPVVLEVQTSEGPKTLRFGPEFKVRPDGAAAKARRRIQRTGLAISPSNYGLDVMPLLLALERYARNPEARKELIPALPAPALPGSA